jgi:hypothetical protein
VRTPDAAREALAVCVSTEMLQKRKPRNWNSILLQLVPLLRTSTARQLCGWGTLLKCSRYLSFGKTLRVRCVGSSQNLEAKSLRSAEQSARFLHAVVTDEVSVPSSPRDVFSEPEQLLGFLFPEYNQRAYSKSQVLRRNTCGPPLVGSVHRDVPSRSEANMRYFLKWRH